MAFIDCTCSDLLSSNTSDATAAVAHARTLYASCIDEASIERDGVMSVLDIVNNEFGGWPILHGATRNTPTFNLMDLLLQLRKYDNGIIFSVATATNQQNSSAYDIELGQGTLGLQETEYYNNETAITEAYRQFMRDLAAELSNDTSAITNDVRDMFLLEKAIAQVGIELCAFELMLLV